MLHRAEGNCKVGWYVFVDVSSDVMKVNLGSYSSSSVTQLKIRLLFLM